MSAGLKPVNDLISLKGKVSMITGAASGIGKATALRFAEAGSDLYLIDINAEGLEGVKGEVKGYGVSAECFRVDLSKFDEIDKLWEGLRGREPDILVNNAGIYVFRDFLEVDEGFLNKVLRINLLSTYRMCQHMIRLRRGRGGVIVNVGSVEAILPFAKGLTHYDISKAGVLALTRALAREYGGEGFRVNAVVPGGIRTPGTDRLKREAIIKLRLDVIGSGIKYFSRLPMKRLGEPDEVARVILFLASDLASYVNGALIPVDGGFLSA